MNCEIKIVESISKYNEQISQKIKDGTVVSPKGFKAAGIACGLKRSGKPDMAIIISDNLANVAGVFTTNQYAAAPIVVARWLLQLQIF